MREKTSFSRKQVCFQATLALALNCVCSMAITRPVGEWDEATAEPSSGLATANLGILLKTLEGAQTWQILIGAQTGVAATASAGTKQVANASEQKSNSALGKPDLTGSASTAVPRSGSSDTPSTDADVGTGTLAPATSAGEVVPNSTSGVFFGGRVSASNASAMRVERSMGEFYKGPSRVMLPGFRGPAVLPKDPSLRAFSRVGQSTFGKASDTSLVAAVDSLDDPNEKKKKEGKKDGEDKDKDQEEFEKGLSDLAGRSAPYFYKDYEDFRKFIASKDNLLGDLDLSASDFKQKAAEIYKTFQDRDVSPITSPAKERFRRFVTEEEEVAQRPLEPMPRRDLFDWGGH